MSQLFLNSLKHISNVALFGAGILMLSSSTACGPPCEFTLSILPPGIEFSPALENAQVTIETGERFGVYARGKDADGNDVSEIVIEERIRDAKVFTFDCVDGVYTTVDDSEGTCDFYAFQPEHQPLDVAVTVVADSGASFRLPKEEGELTPVAFVKTGPVDNCQSARLRGRVYVDTSALAR